MIPAFISNLQWERWNGNMPLELETPPQAKPSHQDDNGGNGRGKGQAIEPRSAKPATVSRTTRRWTIVAGLLIIAAFIIAIVLVMGQISAKMAAAAEAKAAMVPPTPPAPRVATLQLTGIAFEDKLVLPGALKPWLSVALSSETQGPVVAKMIEEGQRVEQGQVIFKINTDTLETELELAKTRLALAEKQYERTSQLYQQNFSTREQLDADENAVEQDKANVRLRELLLQKATVEAPVSGIVNRVYVESGGYVREGDNLCDIIQTDKLKMIVGVPEKDIIYLKEGQQVPVQVDALASSNLDPLAGVIHKIIPAADLETHTFTVEVGINEPGELARAGMIGRAELTRRSIESAILIPIFSVTRHSDGYAVFVEQDGVAHRRIIKVGSFLPQGLQIEEGLAPGDNLVVRGQRDLVDAEEVNVVRRIGPEVFALATKLGTSMSTGDIENFLDAYMNEPLDPEAAGAEQADGTR